jgi:hypothetical protein
VTNSIAPSDGFAVGEELVDRYALCIRRDLGAFRWHGVLACFKLAAAFEGMHARAGAGLALVATGDRLHKAAYALLLRAANWIER